MMLKPILGALAIMLCVPAAATGQPDANANSAAVFEGIYRAGQCIVRSDRAAAIRVLEALPVDGEPQLQSAARLLRDAGCLRSPLPSDFPLFLRGAIAQEMLSSDFPEFGAEPYSVGRLVDLRLPVESDEAPAADESARRYRWSDCVVRNDSQSTERLIRTPMGSDLERKLFKRMAPYFSACMNRSEQLSASAPEIRSLLMQSAYHSLYRLWNGKLRGAGFVNAENPQGKVVCRIYVSTGSRVKTERICMSPRDWDRVRLTTKEDVAAFIMKSVSQPTR